MGKGVNGVAMATFEERVEAFLKEGFEINDLDGNGIVTIDESMTIDKALAQARGVPFDEEASRAEFSESGGEDGKLTLEKAIAVMKPVLLQLPEEECMALIDGAIKDLRAAKGAPDSPR